MTDYAEFQFNRSDLARPRPAGISAYMRIKNEAQFVRLAIESHLPFYDEVIAVYNDCTDDTESILLDLQQQHPNKVKVFHYLPKVHSLGSKEHVATVGNDGDVHSMANYYNFALSKCSYCVAAKLDADHLAIPVNFIEPTKKIREDIAKGINTVSYLQSAINLMQDRNASIGISAKNPFAGNGDYFYHPVSERYTFYNGKTYEIFNKDRLSREFIGITSFHLKLLKNDYGLDSLGRDLAKQRHAEYFEQSEAISFTEFRSQEFRDKLIMQFPKKFQRLAFNPNSFENWFRRVFMGGKLQMRKERVLNLLHYTRNIDFQRDALDHLKK